MNVTHVARVATLALMVGLLHPRASAAAVPEAIHFTGTLVDGSGAGVTGLVRMVFRIYDGSDSAASTLWETAAALDVDVAEGSFSVELGPIGADALESGEAWLGITIVPADAQEPAKEMSPRLKVTAVPYSLQTDHAVSADTCLQASSVTDVNFDSFVTTEQIDQYALVSDLADVCRAPCYGDANVATYLAQHNYGPGPYFSGDYNTLANRPDLSVYAKTGDLALVALSGAYEDLSGTPDLAPYALTAALAPVATSGSYGSLSGTPDLSVYAKAAALDNVAFSGAYADLTGTPDLGMYPMKTDLAPVATSGSYGSLTGAPDLNVYAKTAALDNVAFSGAYADLSGQPDLSIYAPSAALANVAFSGDYADLSGVPTLSTVAASGAYTDLSGKPDLSVYLRKDGAVALAGPWDTAGQPLSNLVVASKTTAPATPKEGQLWWDATAHALKVYTGTKWIAVNGESGPPVATDLDCLGCVSEQELGFGLADVATSGAYVDLTGAPDLSPYAKKADLATVATSGAYGDLSGRPDLAPYAKKADLATVATSGVYGDLNGKPTLATVATSGAYNDLSGKPDLTVYPLKTDLSGTAYTGTASDLVCSTSPCVSSTEVGFTYAASATKGGDASNAEKLGGYTANATGLALPSTVVVTDSAGKIPEALLPFSKGDLLAPADRPLVQGLVAYAASYFSIDELGINGLSAANVKSGVKFGPGKSLSGSFLGDGGFFWWDEPDQYIVYDDFSSSGIDGNLWTLSAGAAGSQISYSTNVRGEAPELLFMSSGGAALIESRALPVGHHIAAKYRAVVNASCGDSCQAEQWSSDYYMCIQCTQPTASVNWYCVSKGPNVGTVFLRALSGGGYDIYIGAVYIYSLPADVPPILQFHVAYRSSEGKSCGLIYIDDVVVSSYNVVSNTRLDCDDQNQCTYDRAAAVDATNCYHVNREGICDDHNACTETDVCTTGQCGGTAVNCDDANEFTNDSCDTIVGCQHTTCPSKTYSFSSGAENWTFGSGWAWDSSGWIQGTGATGAATSPIFSTTTKRLRVRYKCIGPGALVFTPGPTLACQYDGVWVESFVDLGATGTLAVQIAHSGTGSVLVDWIETLVPCL